MSEFMESSKKIEGIITLMNDIAFQTNLLSLNESVDNVSESILSLPDDVLVFAIGNQVGTGQEILQKLSESRDND